ncbi:hypothetical protein KO528_00665 [Saccharophagus degradans]|uniref:Calcineurin-like phosphoesterase domain-containing protein n=1 Tax=Saccharophagus degradans TaxID=86304 RepID=A0AAW7X3F5_9GAMM|nr:hypothetical protein [Saccharophagus degradans]MBU2983848.1 hypothetical protein [Saccharophagus degradans]MDO6422178.1 hypothetical protein [Saccharophagus degradans]MDO6607547.1 hypothetical protein [Saccharophagus degradans]
MLNTIIYIKVAILFFILSIPASAKDKNYFQFNNHAVARIANITVVELDGSKEWSGSVKSDTTIYCDDRSCKSPEAKSLAADITVVSVSGGDNQTRCVVKMFDGGRVNIEKDGNQVYCKSFRRGENSPAVIEPYYTMNSGENRNVQFYAISDTQFDDGETSHKNETAQQVSFAALEGIGNSASSSTHYSPQVRGLIVAGDLTMYSEADKRDCYRAAVWRTSDKVVDQHCKLKRNKNNEGIPANIRREYQTGYSRYIFDGLGNHDERTGDGSVKRDRYSLWPKRARAGNIQMAVGNAEPESSSDIPHYSWDWDDVHFVHLNVYPGDAPCSNCRKGKTVDPYSAINFLLYYGLKNVSRSTPIVLIYHYPLEARDYWSDAQVASFKSAIADYNVVATIVGHYHLDPSVSESSWASLKSFSSESDATCSEYNREHKCLYEFNVSSAFGTELGDDAKMDVNLNGTLVKMDIIGNTFTAKRYSVSFQGDDPVYVNEVSFSIE